MGTLKFIGPMEEDGGEAISSLIVQMSTSDERYMVSDAARHLRKLYPRVRFIHVIYCVRCAAGVNFNNAPCWSC